MKFLPFVFFLTSCMTAEQREGAIRGAAAGAEEFVDGAVQAFSAFETGGLAAGAMALAWAVVKSVKKGLDVSRTRRVREVTEGVKKAKP